MAHYVCTGECKGVSSESNAICQANDCSRFNKKLIECMCEDEEHSEAYDAVEEINE